MSESLGRAAGAHAVVDYAFEPVPDRAICRPVHCAASQTADDRRERTDRLPHALNDLYPVPTRVPDDLNELIDALVDATKRHPAR